MLHEDDILPRLKEPSRRFCQHFMQRMTRQTFSAINLASQQKTTKLSFCSQVRKQLKLLTVPLKPLRCCLQSDKLLRKSVFKLLHDLICQSNRTFWWFPLWFVDHHTKFVNVHPIHNKRADEVLNEVQKYCVTYGYPPKNLTDNGSKFENRKMKAFCSTNQIQLLHGAARTLTTQGLVERLNHTFKE